MKLSKFLLAVLLCWLIFLFPKSTLAADQKTAVIVNPIRGMDFWSYPQTILDTPRKQAEVIQKNNLEATWLVRYDALVNPEVVSFLKSLNNKQEIGLFMEVTPTFASEAGVKYNPSVNWHYVQSVFLVGYSPDDRKKLIDQAVKKFNQQLGSNPKSVGAWWIDAFSLDYMRQKYGIEANLDVADQFSTDQYQVWGQYFSVPFYPSKVNALIPASTADQKLGVVTIQWATRDPFNSYGNGVNDSTYSVQPNDYLLHHLDTSYFEKLLNIYPQVTVGVENDFSWTQIGSEYQNQINLLVRKQNLGQLQIQTMKDFAHYYNQTYPDVSPAVLLLASDPLGSEGQVVWYQTLKYRIGWFYSANGVAIRDLRTYADFSKEACYSVACQKLILNDSFVSVLDDVTLANKITIDEGKISDFSVAQNKDGISINYTNQAGVKRLIRFLANDIEINGKMNTVQSLILDANQAVNKKEVNQVALGQQKPVNWLNTYLGILVGLFKYLILAILFFLIPGLALTRRWLLAIPAGWVMFTLVEFGLGFWQANLLIWLLPFISAFLVYKMKLWKLPEFSFNRQKLIFLLVLGIGVVFWMIPVFKNGLLFGYGLGYWGPNGHDAIWHLSLISELTRNFPPQNPVFAGEKLLNYHLFFDLLLARTSTLFGIDVQDLLFRFFPLFISLLAGVLIYKLVQKIAVEVLHKSLEYANLAGLLAMFFMYFGGSFGWVISFIKDRNFGGESTFWAQQATSTMLNPPFAISLVIFLAGLLIFMDYLKHSKIFDYRLLSIVIIWGSLIEFKAYIGVLLLASLAIMSLEGLIKKQFKILTVFGGVLSLSLLVFLPNNSSSGSLFIFMPLWVVATMISFQDRLDWQRLNLAILSGVPFKVVAAYAIGVVVFLVGNLGTRTIGMISLVKLWKIRLLFYMTLLGIVIPLLFIQKGNSWNIIQFFYYSMFILNILAALTLATLISKYRMPVKLIILGIVVLLTLPTSFDATSQFLPARPPARLPNEELEALNFLKTQPAGIVMTSAFDEKARYHYKEPIPLSAYTSTAYVAAFSNHPTFLEDTINLEILDVDYKGRLNSQRDFAKVRGQTKRILKENNISFVYVRKDSNFEEDEGVMGIRKIFENSQVKIFKVK